MAFAYFLYQKAIKPRAAYLPLSKKKKLKLTSLNHNSVVPNAKKQDRIDHQEKNIQLHTHTHVHIIFQAV